MLSTFFSVQMVAEHLCLYICSSVGCHTLLRTGNELVNQMIWDVVMFVNSKSGFWVEFFHLRMYSWNSQHICIGFGAPSFSCFRH